MTFFKPYRKLNKSSIPNCPVFQDQEG